eukprot:2482666-Prymnesium_polylepis.1
MSEVHRHECSIDVSQQSLLWSISRYISHAADVQLVIVGKSVYVRGAVSAAYACSLLERSLVAARDRWAGAADAAAGAG